MSPEQVVVYFHPIYILHLCFHLMGKNEKNFLQQEALNLA